MKFRYIDVVTTGLFTVAMLIFINPVKTSISEWASELAVHFLPHFALIGCAIALWSGLRGYWVRGPIIFIPTCFFIGAVLSFEGYVTPTTDDQDTARPTVRVLSANVMANAHAVDRLGEIALEKNADVIFIYETPMSDCATLPESFDRFTYCLIETQAPDGGKFNRRIAILARQNPASTRLHAHQSFMRRGAIEAQFDVDGHVVTFFASHPTAPISPDHVGPRNRYIHHVSRHARAAERPIIIGDLNTTPWSPVFQKIPGKRVGDPRLESTWISNLPFIGVPIDHIIIGDQFTPLRYEVLPFIGSDHRPLFAELSIEK